MYLEDYVVGTRTEHPGRVLVGQGEIVEFAQRFDPQYFHVDPAAAANGPYHGLIASGWHTAGLMMRLYADQYLSKVASLGGPGVDELRWHLPVRPGDILRLTTEVLQADRSRSKPDRGLVRTRVELYNQDNTLVLSCIALNLIGARAPIG
ncbi:MaoC family dehydratase [Kribbella sp. NPDC056345]|uniref:MaoC family dehydratase n=1 Tax=Kribbella sp. NPDC056345 TaxID=3345789 RepID=UPI0035D81C21